MSKGMPRLNIKKHFSSLGTMLFLAIWCVFNGAVLKRIQYVKEKRISIHRDVSCARDV